MQLGFFYDQPNCLGCSVCVAACRAWNELDPGMPGFRDQITTEKGKFPGASISFLTPTCFHCSHPGCVTVCPAKAITKREADGIVTVDSEKCKGPEACGHPCSNSCPANNDVLGFVESIKAGDIDRAWSILTETNPLPGVTGRVCFHPCESSCSRAQVEDAIAIHHLERFVADNSSSPVPKKAESKAQTVAVVGSGPAGLSCSYQLARRGYQVTIFEALPVPGGMLRTGISGYRLDRKILDRELAFIQQTGVTIKTGMRLGANLTHAELDKFDAVFLAIGAFKDRVPNIPGKELKGVIAGLDFLREANLTGKATIGKKVLVIGGGNVAVDCARVAVRLGASKVELACLESYNEMPAEKAEIKQAEAEGVTVHPSRSFCRITADGGQVSGVECLSLSSMFFDREGNLHTETITGSEHIINIDTVIFATGQAPDLSSLPADIKTANGIITVDENGTTSKKKYYAGGDAAAGIAERKVAYAIGMGYRAALAIDRDLQGLPPVKTATKGGETKYILSDTSFIEKRERAVMPEITLSRRKREFAEIELGLKAEAARKEAERCLICRGMCRVACPYDAPKFITRSQTRMSKCNFCLDRLDEGKEPACVAACPVFVLEAGPVEELVKKHGAGKTAKGITAHPETGPSVVFKSK